LGYCQEDTSQFGAIEAISSAYLEGKYKHIPITIIIKRLVSIPKCWLQTKTRSLKKKKFLK